ncbi:hypothetical protein PM082_024361 [Marasmius tenuissimus]|nr:hypothetical protein PM082_024361 [Marasmius tenuissimus]
MEPDPYGLVTSTEFRPTISCFRCNSTNNPTSSFESVAVHETLLLTIINNAGPRVLAVHNAAAHNHRYQTLNDRRSLRLPELNDPEPGVQNV